MIGVGKRYPSRVDPANSERPRALMKAGEDAF